MMRCEHQDRQVCMSMLSVGSQGGPFIGCQFVRPPTAVSRSAEPFEVPVWGA
jgi:hypothetical protein